MYELRQPEQEAVIEVYEDWNKKRGGRLSFDDFLCWISELSQCGY